MPYLSIVVVAMSAVFFYRAAESENESSLIWPGLSLAISFATMFWLHWGLLEIILGQVGLFTGITIFRILRKSD